MTMPGRKFSSGGAYRYGFNGQESSDEIAAGLTTAMYWEYDSRIGRRWNVDPVVKIWESSYATFSNTPIWHLDILGNSDTTKSSIPVCLASRSYVTSVKNYIGLFFDPTNPGGNHSHADQIDRTFSLSGGNELFSLNSGVISFMNTKLESVRQGTIILPPNSPAITNLNSAYYSSAESGAEKGWINLLLGGMIKGTIPENIVFSQNGNVSKKLIGTPVYEGILKSWFDIGKPSNNTDPYGFDYGVAAQAGDLITNGLSFLSISNFVGSARGTVVANPSANTIILTITNVSSVNSGDLQKHMFWHDENSPFLLRDPKNKSPQPYTNFSQTYQLKLDYNEVMYHLQLNQIINTPK